VTAAVSSFGRLEVMMNNAGIATPAAGMRLVDHSSEDFDRLVSVNARGVVYGCQEAVRQFERQGDGGVIVNTGSVAGMIAWGGVLYGATKAFVIQLTRALAIEVAPLGIRVNCFCPGGVWTNLGKSETEFFLPPDAETVSGLEKLHPLGRLLTAEDCAKSALFLASELSSSTTGVALPVDGGYLAR
jgi:NAD(P)-dependent dehydrogenase (short-subunit alcohol dehydrogenase family)